MIILRRFIPFISLLFCRLASANVSCGGHSAETCALCPIDENGDDRGKGWCNGECNWIGSTSGCVANSVVCGSGTYAESCAECPIGESGCGNTDCTWHTTTELCRDTFSDNVRTASVWLSYLSPSMLEPKAWWFQRVVPLTSAPATYFSSNVHAFGYGGIQQLDDSTGRVIFSLWDQNGCDTQLNPAGCNQDDIAQYVACGKNVICKGFDGEGTGMQSYYDRKPFQLNENYYFVTQAAYVENNRMEYTGYFYEDGGWRLLSRIQVSTNADKQWSLMSMGSFVEQWTAMETTSDRAALFGPSYVASTNGDDFHQIERAYFTYETPENHERVNAWEEVINGIGALGIETGGDVEQVAQMNDFFTYPDAAPYKELTSFQGYIGCLNEANSKDEIESCLDAPTEQFPSIEPRAKLPTYADDDKPPFPYVTIFVPTMGTLLMLLIILSILYKKKKYCFATFSPVPSDQEDKQNSPLSSKQDDVEDSRRENFIELFQSAMEYEKATEFAKIIVEKDPHITIRDLQFAFKEQTRNKDSFHETLEKEFDIASSIDRSMIICALMGIKYLSKAMEGVGIGGLYLVKNDLNACVKISLAGGDNLSYKDIDSDSFIFGQSVTMDSNSEKHINFDGSTEFLTILVNKDGVECCEDSVNLLSTSGKAFDVISLTNFVSSEFHSKVKRELLRE